MKRGSNFGSDASPSKFAKIRRTLDKKRHDYEVKIQTVLSRSSVWQDAFWIFTHAESSRVGRVFNGICGFVGLFVCLFFHTISQKL